MPTRSRFSLHLAISLVCFVLALTLMVQWGLILFRGEAKTSAVRSVAVAQMPTLPTVPAAAPAPTVDWTREVAATSFPPAPTPQRNPEPALTPMADSAAVKPAATESQDAVLAHAAIGQTADTALSPLPAPEPVLTAPEPTRSRSSEAQVAHGLLIPASLPPRAAADAVAPPTMTERAPRIVIIIDDMGLAVRNSQRVVELPAGLTLSYLPYAENIQAQVDAARARGHEIMLHLPMEPLDRSLSPGPKALTTALSPEKLNENLQANLAAFTGYVGINNHMGSRLTSTPAAMEQVMTDIAPRGVYFVDSWTSPRSVAYQTAAAHGIPRARRDVFLDHEEGQDFVRRALAQLEHIARRHGSAIAIGHPKADTIAVLREWLPQARARGLQIVPMSQLIYHGEVAEDPVLVADQTAARRAAHIAPAAGP